MSSSSWTSIFKDLVDNPTPGTLPLDTNGIGYKVSTGATQLRNIPWNNVDRIILEFDNEIAAGFQPQDFVISGGAGLPQVTAASFDSPSHRLTLTLSGSIPAARLTLTISASAIVNTSGAELDGEWDAEVSTSSGDGAAGGDFVFDVHMLPGDINDDGIVNATDQGLIPSTRNYTNAAYNFWGDINGSNIINSTDRDAVGNLLGSTLP